MAQAQKAVDTSGWMADDKICEYIMRHPLTEEERERNARAAEEFMKNWNDGKPAEDAA